MGVGFRRRDRGATDQNTVKRSAVFLDRDGVLNVASVRDGKPYPPRNMDELRFEPGAAEACLELKAAGHMLIAVTNQPDIARGTTNTAAVGEINDAVKLHTHLDEIRVCAHDDADDCDCRKPKPGLILQAARDHDLDLSRCVMVGDRWRDVEAGALAGVPTVFIDHGYSERRPVDPGHVAKSLAAATPWILNQLSGNP